MSDLPEIDTAPKEFVITMVSPYLRRDYLTLFSRFGKQEHTAPHKAGTCEHCGQDAPHLKINSVRRDGDVPKRNLIAVLCGVVNG